MRQDVECSSVGGAHGKVGSVPPECGQVIRIGPGGGDGGVVLLSRQSL